MKNNTNMIFNDTFPNPFKENDTIYIFFSSFQHKIYITSSFFLSNRENNNIQEKFLASKDNLSEAQKNSNKI